MLAYYVIMNAILCNPDTSLSSFNMCTQQNMISLPVKDRAETKTDLQRVLNRPGKSHIKGCD